VNILATTEESKYIINAWQETVGRFRKKHLMVMPYSQGKTLRQTTQPLHHQKCIKPSGTRAPPLAERIIMKHHIFYN